MTHDDELIKALRAILDAPGTSGKALEAKAAAARQLDRLTGSRNAEGPDLLAELADGAFLDGPATADLEPDTFRDLDFMQIAGEEMEPLFFAWTTFVPRDLSRRQLLAAQQAFMRRARAADVTAGPDGEPVGDDELSRRRRRRAN
jgi:hypothetical protein